MFISVLEVCRIERLFLLILTGGLRSIKSSLPPFNEEVYLNGEFLNGAVVAGSPRRQSGTYRLLQWLRGRNQTAGECLETVCS